MPYPNLIPHQTLVKNVAEFFTSAALDPAYFDSINKHLLAQGKPADKASSALRHLGFLRPKDFIDYGVFGNMGLDIRLLEEILDAFVSIQLLKKGGLNMLIYTHDTFYNANTDAEYLLKNDLLMNRLFGFEYIIDQYLPTVYKLETWKNGDCGIGNGFLVDYLGTPVVVTNKHVVNGK